MADNLTDDLVEQYNHGKEYQLNEYETSFLKELDTLLMYHIYKQRVITNLLTYISTTRLGYTKVHEGYDLQYSIDSDKEPYTLRIKEVPREA